MSVRKQRPLAALRKRREDSSGANRAPQRGSYSQSEGRRDVKVVKEEDEENKKATSAAKAQSINDCDARGKRLALRSCSSSSCCCRSIPTPTSAFAGSSARTQRAVM